MFWFGLVIGFFVGAVTVFGIIAAVMFFRCDNNERWWDDD